MHLYIHLVTNIFLDNFEPIVLKQQMVIIVTEQVWQASECLLVIVVQNPWRTSKETSDQ